jgi:phage shock protein C
MTGYDYNNRPAIRAERSGFGLDRANGKIGGVCAGIARWMGVNPLWVRAGFVAGTVLGFGSFVLIYGAVWLIAD